ncbi:MAG: prephenate dehydrogenase/arogenate dehydrogenase family protein [Chloroflexi bacterium]|nr:prephenate dehydrogenase/arogenate dehydrogenase family protein [Chloroflexota bacterium]
MGVNDLCSAQVSIVGLGLMGGSLAGALRGQCRSVVGVARRTETIEAALAQGLIDRGTTDLAGGVRQADVVVLATPVRVVIQQLAEIGPLLPQGCLLMDLGSTKADIVAAMARLPEHVQPLGAHPMCGKEVSGLEVADAAIYQGRTFILCPLPRTSQAALALGRSLAKAVGAQPLVLEADRQDVLVATLSHLPYLLACALVATADATTSADPAAWEIVAGGFRDTSRVAGSDVTMMMDILLTNQEEVLKALRAFGTQLHNLTRLVEAGDEEEMRAALSRIRQERMRMFP